MGKFLAYLMNISRLPWRRRTLRDDFHLALGDAVYGTIWLGPCWEAEKEGLCWEPEKGEADWMDNGGELE